MFRFGFSIAALILGLALPHIAYAYVGPGAGISAIGTFVAMIGAIILLIVGFVWFPVKRLLRSRKKSKTANKNPTTDQT